MFPRALKVAVLDDEARFRQALSRLLKTYGFKVRSFETGQDLVAALKEESFDCLLLDLHMPGMTGFDVLRRLITWSAAPPVIVITGQDEPGNADRLRAMAVADYLLKPVDETALLKAIERCVSPAFNDHEKSAPKETRGDKATAA